MAAQIFDPRRELKFSTLAYTCMLNEYRQSVRKSRRSVLAASFEDPVPNSSLVFGNMIADMADVCNLSPDAVDVQMDLDRFMDGKPDKHRCIIRMAVAGINRFEIARKLGVSKSYVSYVLKKVRREFSDWYQSA